MTNFNLLVGGPNSSLPEQLPSNYPWIGADRGAFHLVQQHLPLAFAVGDFDSLTAAERHQVEAAVSDIHYSIPEKDDTDTELALQLAFDQYGADAVTIYGATGGRLDHLLSNLFVPLQSRFLANVENIHFVDRQNRVDYYRPGQHQLRAQNDYRYLGIVPMMAVAHLTISGAKYPLTDWSNQAPYSFASNEFVGQQPATIQFERGIVAVIYSRDLRGQQTDN
ncbi:thiamine diphosphokinase [Lacticaseibacillus brantae]|uniref:Thiamine diphosphokinase n=1 Tax=Lacticaseibacillus brantae DSM 23927 TaxID=1423727 RepID=A0A0R2B214_9LACO|nr:thiamine diphosphokinase [Lacticaseibacillus brantae]KRM72802.1 thiamine pyrophosphokinase [Lacticaseibacillus brantae DSM 23927]